MGTCRDTRSLSTEHDQCAALPKSPQPLAWLTCVARQRSLQSNVRDKQVVVMAHSPRGHEVTRIISMRKANRREQKIYQKRFGET